MCIGNNPFVFWSITKEPWHFRYVGKEIAKIIHDNNWTLEEYVLHYGLGSDCLITK